MCFEGLIDIVVYVGSGIGAEPGVRIAVEGSPERAQPRRLMDLPDRGCRHHASHLIVFAFRYRSEMSKDSITRNAGIVNSLGPELDMALEHLFTRAVEIGRRILRAVSELCQRTIAVSEVRFPSRDDTREKPLLTGTRQTVVLPLHFLANNVARPVRRKIAYGWALIADLRGQPGIRQKANLQAPRRTAGPVCPLGRTRNAAQQP